MQGGSTKEIIVTLSHVTKKYSCSKVIHTVSFSLSHVTFCVKLVRLAGRDARFVRPKCIRGLLVIFRRVMPLEEDARAVRPYLLIVIPREQKVGNFVIFFAVVIC